MKMKTKTGLLALGLFTFTATAVVNCGGSSEDGNGSTGTAGKGGSSSMAGSSSKAGSTGSTTAGTASGGADSGTTGMTSPTGGSSGTAGTGGRPGFGGDNGFPGFGGDNGFPGFGGDNGFPGFGGANSFTPADCPAGTVDGGMYMRAMGQGTNACVQADGSFCTCQRAQGNGMSTYRCFTAMLGAGGDNGGFGAATCPDAAKSGDDCTDGPGACTGQNRCFCNQQNKITCF